MARPLGAAEGGGQTTLALEVESGPLGAETGEGHTGATRRLPLGTEPVRNTHRHLRTGRRPPISTQCLPCEAARSVVSHLHFTPFSSEFKKIHITPVTSSAPRLPALGQRGIRYTRQLCLGGRGAGAMAQTHTHISAHELCFLTDTMCRSPPFPPSQTGWWCNQDRTSVRSVAPPPLCSVHLGLGEPKQPADGVG